jgi:peptidoglycan/LPS O-acetylase OafA/YrhL
MTAPPSPSAAPGEGIRRGDLDALRSVAMLLGIVLHASLAYIQFAWPVQDPSRAGLLLPLFAAIHGFRMPLFFLLSGFFTMLVFRRRGLRAVVEQRALRILLPLAIATVTILPIDRMVMDWAVGRSRAATTAASELVAGILAGDAAAVRRLRVGSQELAAPDSQWGLTPLALAAMEGDADVVAALLDAGAAVDGRNGNGGTPLHAAAFMGQADVVDLLLARGADPAATTTAGDTPLQAFVVPPGIAVIAGGFIGLPRRTAVDVETGRRRIQAVLGPLVPAAAAATPFESLVARYRTALAAPQLAVDVAGQPWQLFETDIFDHLWFLWYLCWLVAAFAVAVAVGLAPTGRFRWWLVPASCLPYAFMWSPFGPDTALGIVPAPHLIAFYGCFFWFGAATYAAEGAETPLGARWPLLLPVAFLVIFPTAIATAHERSLAATLQPAFAWATAIGLIGLFRRCFARPSAALRWLADACYWMYLAHLPLVIACQSLLRERPWPAGAKFLVVIMVAVVVLLVTYRWCVRYTPIGWLLNGRRSPP